MHTNPENNSDTLDPGANASAEFEEQMEAISASPSTTPKAAPTAKPSHIKIAPLDVETAYAEKLDSGEITREQLAAILWLLDFTKTRKLNASGIAKMLECHHSTILRVFDASYKASLDNFVGKIEAFRTLQDQRSKITRIKFVETSVSRTIFHACDTARVYQSFVLVDGESQIGKTEACMEYQRLNNHGQTYYVRMPDGGNLSEFLFELAKAVGENGYSKNTLVLKQRIKKALGPSKVLVIDEIDECVIQSTKGGIRYNTLAFIRTLFDQSGCGLILIGTHIFRDAIERGKAKEILERMRRRQMATVQLPPVIPQADMDAIATAYGLPPADSSMAEFRLDIVIKNGLRAYTNYLKAGAMIAEKSGATMTWAHFTKAHAIVAKLSVKSR